MKMIEKYIQENYDNYHARVFRYMRSVGITNIDEVKQKCIVFISEARKILYKLHYKGFIM